MGLSPGFSPIRMPASVPPETMARQQQEQTKMQQLASQYRDCHCVACNFASAQDMLNALRSEREREIGAHEAAHASAAGIYGGGIVIERDSNGIPIGGHVPINIPPLDPQNPESSMQAYETIRGAALAPSDPSGADLSIASQAQSLFGQAQVLMNQKQNGAKGRGPIALPGLPPN